MLTIINDTSHEENTFEIIFKILNTDNTNI